MPAHLDAPRTHSDRQRERALKWLGTEIEYVHSPRFDAPNAAESILAPLDDPEIGRRLDEAAAFVPPPGTPAYIAELYRVPLLTPAQEQHLFSRMNFLKHRANQLRSRLDPDRPDVAAMDQLEAQVADAVSIRNDIVRANLRLVVSLATNLVDEGIWFDDLVAEGHLPLIRAVELFDVDRGFRFSTYATWAVRNNLHRLGPRTRRRLQRFATGQEAAFDGLGDDGGSALRDELRTADLERSAHGLLGALGERDRVVVEARFGIGSEPRPHRFREIAERLELSTERVRQLFVRSLARLRDAADESRIELE